jgi:hypothetical protein
MKWLRASVYTILTAALLWASGIIPAIIPQAVPLANKIGNSTKFQLGSTGAVSGDCASFDASLNITGPGTGAGCGGGGASGALVLLESHTASNSTALAFTTRNAAGQSGASFQSDYDVYQFESVMLVPSVAGGVIGLQMSSDGGSTFITANYRDSNWRWNTAGAAASGQTGATFMYLVSVSDTIATQPFEGSLKLYNPLSTTPPVVSGQLSYYLNGSGVLQGVDMRGAFDGGVAIDALHFFSTSGNLASGTVRLYGIAK